MQPWWLWHAHGKLIPPSHHPVDKKSKPHFPPAPICINGSTSTERESAQPTSAFSIGECKATADLGLIKLQPFLQCARESLTPAGARCVDIGAHIENAPRSIPPCSGRNGDDAGRADNKRPELLSCTARGKRKLFSQPKTTSLLFDYEGLSVGEQVAAGNVCVCVVLFRAKFCNFVVGLKQFFRILPWQRFHHLFPPQKFSFPAHTNFPNHLMTQLFSSPFDWVSLFDSYSNKRGIEFHQQKWTKGSILDLFSVREKPPQWVCIDIHPQSIPLPHTKTQ